jgi:hypothetical protein
MSDPAALAGRRAPERVTASPHSLERTRLLLSWLRAQRAVDQCLSELLAAGPAGERRVGSSIDRVDALVAAATGAFEAYRASVTGETASQIVPGEPAGDAQVINLVHRTS